MDQRMIAKIRSRLYALKRKYQSETLYQLGLDDALHVITKVVHEDAQRCESQNEVIEDDVLSDV